MSFAGKHSNQSRPRLRQVFLKGSAEKIILNCSVDLDETPRASATSIKPEQIYFEVGEVDGELQTVKEEEDKTVIETEGRKKSSKKANNTPG